MGVPTQVIEHVPHDACLSIGVLNTPDVDACQGLQAHLEAFDAVVVGDDASLRAVCDVLPVERLQ